jgi:hypothetical protein
MIEVIKMVSKTTNFNIKGNVNGEGTTLFQTLYGYSISPTAEPGIFLFICQSKTKWTVLNKEGSIEFESEVRFLIQKVPTDNTTYISNLLSLAEDARHEMMKLLNLDIVKRTDLSPLEITPINVEETIPVLETCLSRL